LCDADKNVLARGVANVGEVESYTDIRKLLESKNIDAISIATPNHLHAAQAVAAVRFPGIDVLCNIAGGFRMGQPVHETPESVWELMLDLNAKSVINTARAVVPKMLAAGRGKIINIGAVAGLAGDENLNAAAQRLEEAARNGATWETRAALHTELKLRAETLHATITAWPKPAGSW